MPFIAFICFLICGSVFATSKPCKQYVIDYSDFSLPEKRQELTATINRAFQEQGFLFITNTPIEKKTVKKAYKASKRFFSRPELEKRKFNGSEVNYQRGYCPLRLERAKNHVLGDYKESFMFGVNKGGPYPNVFPSKEFKEALVPLSKQLMCIAIESLELIEESLGLEKGRFKCFLGDGDASAIRVKCHPPLPEDSTERTWAAPHTDISFITLNPQPDVSGLKALDDRGQWREVEMPKDSIMLKVGDQLQNITNGYYISTMYQVVASERTRNSSRYSISLYCHPKGSTDLTPIPSLVEKTGKCVGYPSATRDELLIERLIDINLAGDDAIHFLDRSGLITRMIDKKRSSPRVVKKLSEFRKRQQSLARRAHR